MQSGVQKILTSVLVCLASSTYAGGHTFALGGWDGARVTAEYSFEPRPLNGTFDLVPEVGVSYWRGHRGAFQLHAVPMFRARLTPTWYLEAGIGASYFTRTTFARQNIDTHFQFADQLGVGYVLGHSSVALRLEHFSNGGIRNPNPGVNAVQLVYTAGY